MPRGTAHLVNGLLIVEGDGFALDVDGGGRWRLDVSDNRAATRMAGRRVTVSGRRSGFDLLDVETISISITSVREVIGAGESTSARKAGG